MVWYTFRVNCRKTFLHCTTTHSWLMMTYCTIHMLRIGRFVHLFSIFHHCVCTRAREDETETETQCQMWSTIGCLVRFVSIAVCWLLLLFSVFYFFFTYHIWFAVFHFLFIEFIYILIKLGKRTNDDAILCRVCVCNILCDGIAHSVPRIHWIHECTMSVRNRTWTHWMRITKLQIFHSFFFFQFGLVFDQTFSQRKWKWKWTKKTTKRIGRRE